MDIFYIDILKLGHLLEHLLDVFSEKYTHLPKRGRSYLR
jgi:hypothetical protein